ncbi:MAG: butyrate kinase [Parasporobacterium sp.]|nr:butyrate kinase [Parasporobacterium sp.]
MKDYCILTINPGSTSTKVGVFKGSEKILDKTVDHHKEDFADCKTFDDQEPIRMQHILNGVKEAGVELSELDAIGGRGVGLYPCAAGTYKIDDLVIDHCRKDVAGVGNPGATLGIKLSYQLSKELNIPAFFVNPMPTDEFIDEARMTGIRGVYRGARGHALNMKQVARVHSEKMGVKYEEQNYIVMHLGGGVSINAHRKGRMIDGNRGGEGQGPMSPNRAGDFCVDDVINAMKIGYTLEEINELVSIKGGLLQLCGTDDLRQVREMINAGDELATIAYKTMVYGMGKWAAMMAGALKGEVDAILLTGGLAKDPELVKDLKEYISWIAPIYEYPGSFETDALGYGVLQVLTGAEEAKTYSGHPVWEGFSFDHKNESE